MRMGLVALGGAVMATALTAYAMPRVLAGPDPFDPCRQADLAAVDAIEGKFSLINEAGQAVTEADVVTGPTLVYFGYTFCPDVCPLDNYRNAEAVDLLAEQGIAAKAVFVTVDPERDTQEVVAEYTDFFHEDLEGLTGTPSQTEAAARSFRAVSEIRDGDDPEYYLIDHSTLTYLMLPGHGTVDLVRRASSPEEVASQLACFDGLDLSA